MRYLWRAECLALPVRVQNSRKDYVTLAVFRALAVYEVIYPCGCVESFAYLPEDFWNAADPVSQEKSA